MGEHSPALLTDLLKDVSRSFYLTMRVLPGAIRPQISLAYLLARTADTIADTEIIPMERRLDALENLRARISESPGFNSAPLDFGELALQQASNAERILLERVEDSLRLLGGFSRDDQQLIREVLDTISGGQILDLKRFANPSENQIVSLNTTSELDDYTYRVAGCVGEFWTRMCLEHLFKDAGLDQDVLLSNSIRFGKGLQLVNILRDLPRDLRMGRCYIPQELLREVELSPTQLLSSSSEPIFRPIYEKLLCLAVQYLSSGWEYTKGLPYSGFRVRISCALPILIGVATLEKLRSAKVLDPNHRVKISRGELRRIFARCVSTYPIPSLWNRQFRQARRLRGIC